jgi:hypothetical protein
VSTAVVSETERVASVIRWLRLSEFYHLTGTRGSGMEKSDRSAGELLVLLGKVETELREQALS